MKLDVLGRWYPIDDRKFFDRRARITRAFISTDGEYCIECYPDNLHMMYVHKTYEGLMKRIAEAALITS